MKIASTKQEFDNVRAEFVAFNEEACVGSCWVRVVVGLTIESAVGASWTLSVLLLEHSQKMERSSILGKPPRLLALDTASTRRASAFGGTRDMIPMRGGSEAGCVRLP